jgi:phosphatidylglycerol:prolipoprotein diacylglycerol transferase
VILWFFARKPRPTGMVSGVFLIGYGCFRFIAEYFREPDRDLGLQALGLSRGQWLCVPMVLAGIAICLIVKSRVRRAEAA